MTKISDTEKYGDHINIHGDINKFLWASYKNYNVYTIEMHSILRVRSTVINIAKKDVMNKMHRILNMIAGCALVHDI